MSQSVISLEYVNSILHDLEKAFWDERGRGARFRVTTVGRDYFLDKCRPRIVTAELEPIGQAVEDLLVEEGIVASICHEVDGKLLRLNIEGCLHQAVEQRLVVKGVEPFTCVPANLLVMAIEDTLDRPVELAEIKVEDGACHAVLVLFDSRPTFE
jgi:hypothetical protein